MRLMEGEEREDNKKTHRNVHGHLFNLGVVD